MIDFIELNTYREGIGEHPIMVRKSNVIAIRPEKVGTTLFLNSGDMFHVKQLYHEIKEQFKFE